EVKPDQKNGLSAISVGLVFQIRAIDKKRLKKKIGELDDMMLEKIDKQLKNLLQLK
ncbi:type II toxin-antitoxin system PemK/MazF family toxin, partial [Candidatus Woesearchaeota archaeon]|nr:type II toxin-antitoxin system PemK/MazF family toxin [Candidatus Woesearchaeota archaeon]